MVNKIGIGIIGTGIGLRQVAPGFLLTGQAKLVAVCGSSIERAKEHCADFDVDLITDDYKAVCDNSDVDIICVTTPNEFHIEHMTYALNTDKHVFLEKPVGMTAEETRKLAELVKDNSRLVLVGHQLRFNPYFVAIKNVIGSGKIGKVYYMNVNQCSNALGEEQRKWMWSFDVEKGGGVRLALGVHLVDLARFILDADPIATVGTLNPIFDTRLDDEGIARESFASRFFSASLNFEDALVEMSTTAAGKTKAMFNIIVRGQHGDLTFDLENKLTLYKVDGSVEKVVNSDTDKAYDALDGPSIFWDSFTYYAQEIVDAIQGGSNSIESASTMNDAITNMEILDATLTSHLKGTRELLKPWITKKYS